MLQNPLLAPVYGNFTGCTPIYLFASKSEVLYDDSRLMFKRLREQGVRSALFVREGMVHTWPIFPFMAEGKKDLKLVGRIIAQAFGGNEADLPDRGRPVLLQ